MKKLMVCMLALTFLMGMSAFAQDTMAPAPGDKPAAGAPLMTLKGTVKFDGDKAMFTNDKDGKTWSVMNSDKLQGHDGHHVQLSAHVYPDKESIHVMSVKMLKGGSMGNDSMNK